ncbi:CsgG/HfaB family protein [Cerasicoccus maritimus]|uniref:CsgG/HfaB family protein n=1 Tax=Cerasicoccus maritimus TaxID=490089 RepID=UPI00285268D3|nr:CsgG/HfaB family protein [Cerasicoccus maritimus]
MKPIFALLALVASAALSHAAKPTLAIPPVQVNTALQSESSADRAALPQFVASLQSSLGSAFGETGKFAVISRTDMKSLIDEQTLGQSGNLDPDTAAAQGKIAGAQYVLVVNVTNFTAVQEKAHFSAIGRDQTRNIVYLTADAKLYDSSTGALTASSSTTVDSSRTDNYFSYGLREGSLNNVLFNEVAQVVAADIAVQITADLFPAKVVAKTGKQITINKGSAHGFNHDGKTMSIYAVGEEMTDPDTGESLGQEEVFLGTAHILRQDERLTIAILQDDNGVERGHIVRVE